MPRKALLDWLRNQLCTLLFLSPLAVTAADYDPLEAFPVLFPAVQQSGIFIDDKFFADAVPRLPPQQVRAAYREHLLRFIEQHFELPATGTGYGASGPGQTLPDYLTGLLTSLTTLPQPGKYDTLLAVPNPTMLSGGAAREFYYWDSYFTALGWQVLDQYQAIEDQIANLAWFLDTLGYIPNSNRSYKISHSQPPVFSLLIDMLAQARGDQVLQTYLPQLMTEYRFWMDGSEQIDAATPAYRRIVRMPDGSVLNRYWDDGKGPRLEHYRHDLALLRTTRREPEILLDNLRATEESGWDFSSRWLSVPGYLVTLDTIHIVPVDLNALLHNLETTLARAFQQAGQLTDARAFQDKAQARYQAMQNYLWDNDLGAFQDYHLATGEHTGRLSMATCYPLWLKIAKPEQAERVARLVRQRFLRPGGLVSTPFETHADLQWDAPYGVAPVQWVAIAGFRNYQLDATAKEIASRWINLNRKVFRDIGKIAWNYDVQQQSLPQGRPPTFGGVGWAAGVLLRLLQDYPEQRSQPQASPE